MKRLRFSLPFPAVLLLLLAGLGAAVAEGDKKKTEEEKKPAAPPDPNLVIKIDFEAAEAGAVPDALTVMDGEWSVAEIDGGKALRLAPAPLSESAVQLGASQKGGGVITARIRAEAGKRSHPRFGVALHGLAGFRLRLVPARKTIELSKGDDILETAPHDWKKNGWVRLELTVREKGEEAWTVEGRAWNEGKPRPEKPQIVHEATGVKLSGKGSVVGTPYTGLPIFYDDIEIRKTGAPPEDAP
ncbi:MAG: hypothetical protein H7A52_10065 [Akkermansiaceae bacterium]|nr:hypothetical protein [Akkermansiaceae bacterium]